MPFRPFTIPAPVLLRNGSMDVATEIATRAPFRIDVPEETLEDLRRRLAAFRPAPAASGDDGGLGLDPRYLRELVDYWRSGFDWGRQEKKLNRCPQFTATIDGTRLHFIHERGRGPSPIPLLLIHGFPDSFYRFHELIPLLTDPAAHGGDPADAFDVVVPSLPGYGFSEPRHVRGGLFGFGDLLDELMRDVLGYERYGAHGGDWGSTITEQIARSHGRSVVGIHLTDVPFWHALRKPAKVSAAEEKYLGQIEEFQKRDGAYALIQATRPRTLEAGLMDSPAGLAAWIVEKFQAWSDCEGDVELCFSRDELLTNVMIYWATGTIGTSFQPYSDVMGAGAARWMKEAAKNLVGSKSVPAAFAMFPKDLSSPPREWAERFFHVVRWSEMPRGGHFAAMEQPGLLAADLRAFFRDRRAPGDEAAPPI
jgi:pimeloyl-ACP methyl ester carboxylesterase